MNTLSFGDRARLDGVTGERGGSASVLPCSLAYLVERLRKSLFGAPAREAARWPGATLRVPVNLFDIVTVHAVKSGPP